jgi:hypothetical protein
VTGLPIFWREREREGGILPLSRVYEANLLGHPGSEVADTMFLQTIRNSH